MFNDFPAPELVCSSSAPRRFPSRSSYFCSPKYLSRAVVHMGKRLEPRLYLNRLALRTHVAYMMQHQIHTCTTVSLGPLLVKTCLFFN